MNGYAHVDYAASLAEFGSPRLLPECGGWILERPILGTSYRDAMGCYPLFSCGDWPALARDLETISDVISLVLVTDPFGVYSEELLNGAFGDLVKPFKEHFVVDLLATPKEFVQSHHQRNARKALAAVSIERGEPVESCASEWTSLYANLINRHSIKGIAHFSEPSFAKQLRVPGALMMRAVREGRTVGMTWWFVSGGVGYYHLGAYSDEGYELRASFALFWRAIEVFRAEGVRWLDLGAGAGLGTDPTDGLSRFKRGWSTGTRTAYLCGKIFNRSLYNEISTARGAAGSNYFPAYRQGEFG